VRLSIKGELEGSLVENAVDTSWVDSHKMARRIKPDEDGLTAKFQHAPVAVFADLDMALVVIGERLTQERTRYPNLLNHFGKELRSLYLQDLGSTWQDMGLGRPLVVTRLDLLNL